MMSAERLLRDGTLLPGDVVVDENTHRPMQVTGFDMRDARRVPEVWDSDVNQHHHDIDPDAEVVELVELPTGRRYFVPDTVERFPSMRLKRVLTEPATEDRRVQEKVVRAVLANLVADAREQGHGKVAEAILTLCRAQWDDGYVDEIAEIADAMGPLVEGGDD